MRRRVIFLILCIVCTAVAIGYVVYTVRSRTALATASPPGSVLQTSAPAVPALQETLPTAPARLALLYRSTTIDANYGRLALLPLRLDESRPSFLALRCERVHFAAGWGVCLTAQRGVFTTYGAEVFDAQWTRRHHFPLAGIPSRTRVAPDGRYAAITVFVSGHSYAGTDFSTQTLLLDPATGQTLGDLEHYTLWQEGVLVQRSDVNIWGVTFTRDSDRFYATLRTAGTPYLMEGQVSTRQAWLRRAGVECPSLSPDNTRLAFKKRLGGPLVRWRLHVLELATGTETALAETRNVDDQVEWLDDRQVMYALPESMTTASARTHVWVVAADGSGSPRILAEQAASPAVLQTKDGV